MLLLSRPVIKHCHPERNREGSAFSRGCQILRGVRLRIQAVQSNLDLRIATARIREARAMRGVTAAGWYPMVDVSGSYSHSRTSLNTNQTRNVSSFPGFKRESDLWQAGFDASWEID